MAPLQQVDVNIRNDLATVESQLLTAVTEGPDAMDAFATWWSDLQGRVEHALSEKKLSYPTTQIAHEVAASVDVICRSFLSADEVAITTLSRLETDYSQILDVAGYRMETPSNSRGRRSKSHSLSTASSPTGVRIIHGSSDEKEPDSSLPGDNASKFKACKDFFLVNFSSPYPTATQKKTIMEDTDLTMKSVTDWFTNIRRRSGWSAILKEHAHNEKAEMKVLVDRVLSPATLPEVDPEIVSHVMKARKYVEDIMKEEVSPIFEAVMSMKPKTDEEVKAWMEQKALARRKKATEKVRSSQTVEMVGKDMHQAAGKPSTGLIDGACPKRKRATDENSPPKRKHCGEDGPPSAPSDEDRPSKRARSLEQQPAIPIPLQVAPVEDDRPSKRTRTAQPVATPPQTRKGKNAPRVARSCHASPPLSEPHSPDVSMDQFDVYGSSIDIHADMYPQTDLSQPSELFLDLSPFQTSGTSDPSFSTSEFDLAWGLCNGVDNPHNHNRTIESWMQSTAPGDDQQMFWQGALEVLQQAGSAATPSKADDDSNQQHNSMHLHRAADLSLNGNLTEPLSAEMSALLNATFHSTASATDFPAQPDVRENDARDVLSIPVSHLPLHSSTPTRPSASLGESFSCHAQSQWSPSSDEDNCATSPSSNDTRPSTPDYSYSQDSDLSTLSAHSSFTDPFIASFSSDESTSPSILPIIADSSVPPEMADEVMFAAQQAAFAREQMKKFQEQASVWEARAAQMARQARSVSSSSQAPVYSP